MSVLFVTSFSRDLYAVSGRQLVASFAKVQPSGTLLCCVEGVSESELRRDAGEPERLVYYDLAENTVLRLWLRANRDVIPDYLGGLAKECACPGREKRHAKHKPRCHWSWMMRNASRFYRKVAALYYAVNAYGAQEFRYLVWLDSDVLFHKPVPGNYWQVQLAGQALFYCRGHRPAVESGILCFDLRHGGTTFITDLQACYASQAYRRYERWDDGYVMAMLLDTKKYAALDLVHPTKYKGKTNDVIPTTALAEYLTHRKGRNGTGTGTMR